METLSNSLLEIPFNLLEPLIYLLKVNLYWILFYGLYRILLRNNTFFKLNRFYLLTSLTLSLALPFIEFTETVTRRAPILTDATTKTSAYQDLAKMTDSGTKWELVLLCVYALVAFYMCFMLLKGFYNLTRIIKRNECLEFGEYNLVLLPETETINSGVGSFSFFKWLIVSYNDYENHLETILQHEFVHIKQWHSVDILFVETLKVIFWFNPVLWFYKFSICEVHEFLADERAENRDSYASFLISYAQKSLALSITNQFFNASLLKGRIKMIYTNRTSKLSLIKYLMIVPLIGFITFKTAAHKTLFIIDEQPGWVYTYNQASTYNKPLNTDENLISQISISSNVYPEVKRNKKHNSGESKVKKEGNKSSDSKMNYTNYTPQPDLGNAQDTLKEQKTKFMNYAANYRIVPVVMQQVKPFFPTLANSSEGKTKFMNFSSKEVPKTDVSTLNYGFKSSHRMTPIFAPLKYNKMSFPEK